MENETKVNSELRSRLERAAEESKSPIRPTIGILRAIREVFTGPENGALPNPEEEERHAPPVVKRAAS